VPVVGDRTSEADETILLNFSNPVNIVLADSQAVATITDDDPLPELSVTNVAILEGNSGTKNLSFTIRLSAVSGRLVTVQYATADGTATAGSDYVPRSGTLTFLSGWIAQSVTVVIQGDESIEGDEQFVLNLLGASNAVIAGPGQGLILDDEQGPSGSSVSVAALVLTAPDDQPPSDTTVLPTRSERSVDHRRGEEDSGRHSPDTVANQVDGSDPIQRGRPSASDVDDLLGDEELLAELLA
jgi:hypothetical protein